MSTLSAELNYYPDLIICLFFSALFAILSAFFDTLLFGKITLSKSITAIFWGVQFFFVCLQNFKGPVSCNMALFILFGFSSWCLTN